MSSFEVVVMDGGIFILPEELAFMLGDSRIVYLMPDVNEKSLILLQNVEMVKMMESWRRKMATEARRLRGSEWCNMLRLCASESL